MDRTKPLKVISPVIVASLLTGISVIRISVSNHTPADGPSFGCCFVMDVKSYKRLEVDHILNFLI